MRRARASRAASTSASSTTSTSGSRPSLNPRLASQLEEPRPAHDARDEQHRIGPAVARLFDLALVDDEHVREQGHATSRSIEARPRRGQVFPRSVEESRVAEDADHGRAGFGVGQRAIRRGERARERPRARTAQLHFGHEPQGRAGAAPQRRDHVDGLARGRLSGHPPERGDLGSLGREDVGEEAHGADGVRCSSAARVRSAALFHRSSVSRAAPASSSARRARSAQARSSSPVASDERRGGIENHRLARRVRLAREDAGDGERVARRVAAGDRRQGEARDPEVLGRHHELAHVAVHGELADARGRARAHFVEPVFAMDHPCPLAAEAPEGPGEGRAEGVGVHADQLVRRAGRVGDGAERVEDRAGSELAARLGRVLQGGVVGRGEEEGDADLAQDVALAVGGDVDGDAEGLEDVGAAAAGRDAAVAVLRDGKAARRDDHRGGCRDVQRVRPVAAGSARVDDDRQPVLDLRHRTAHRLGGTDDDVGRLPVDAQRHGEGADLHRRPRAREDRVERRANVGGAHGFARQEAPASTRPEVGAHDPAPRRSGFRACAWRLTRPSQLPTSRLPSRVSTLSG